MERLTDRNKPLPSLTPDNASWWALVALRLADYEDSGLTPHIAQKFGSVVLSMEQSKCEACNAATKLLYNSVIKED